MSKKPALPLESPGEVLIPSHGNGWLRPFRPGQSGNPTGHSGRYGEVVKLTRRNAVDAVQVLVEIMNDRTEDTRCRIVAATAVLDRAFGKPKEMDRDSSGSPAIELAGASEAQLRLLLATVLAAEKATGEGESESE